MGKNKNKKTTEVTRKYKTAEQEAKRVLVPILNYKPTVWSAIVDLDLNDSDVMSKCLSMIHEKVPDCSVLLISESVTVADSAELIGVAALSVNPKLEVHSWITAVCDAMDGVERGLASWIEKSSDQDVPILLQLLNTETGTSALKEKDKGLSGSQMWLKKEEFADDSDTDSGENFMASFEFE